MKRVILPNRDNLFQAPNSHNGILFTMKPNCKFPNCYNETVIPKVKNP